MFSKICTTAATALLVLSGPALADWNASVVSQGITAPNATGQVDCPAGGTPGAIWGTGTYTSDSSICGAAQHYGWLAPGSGGTVTYRTVPGQASYEGSAQNGITTNDYPSWGLSFQITGFTPAPTVGGHQQITWSDNPDSLGYGADVGSVHRFACAPNASPAGTIWGTGPYTSDSPICVAAQHRGLITPATGGIVNVIITGANDSYGSSTHNGITSSSYPAWPRSYTFQ